MRRVKSVPSDDLRGCPRSPTAGGFVLGGLIALASALMVPASAWALRTRERYGVLTHSG